MSKTYDKFQPFDQNATTFVQLQKWLFRLPKKIVEGANTMYKQMHNILSPTSKDTEEYP